MVNLREILVYVFAVLSFALASVYLVRQYAVYLTAKINLTFTLISFNILMGFLCSLLAYFVYKDNKKLAELSDRCKRLEQEKLSKNDGDRNE